MIDKIDNEDEYIRVKKMICRSLIIGPIGTFFFAVLFLFIAIFSYEINTYISAFSFFITIMSLLLLIPCFISSEEIMGDVSAYWKYKKNSLLFDVQLFENLPIMLINYSYDKKNLIYKKIFNKLCTSITQRILCTDNLTTIQALNIIIVNNIIKNKKSKETFPNFLENYFQYYYSNLEIFTKKNTPEEYTILFIHLIYHLKLNNNPKWQEFYPLINEELFFDRSINEYYKKQAEQICYNKDNTKYLLNNSNIKPSSYYKLYDIINYHYDDEKELNNYIPQKHMM